MTDTRVSIFNADGQSAYIDYRTEATNLEGRQVIVVGDPSVNDAVAAVASLDPGPTSTAYGQVVRLAGSAQVVFTSTPGTVGVNLGKVDGTIQVNVGKIDDLVAIKTTSASGSLAVHLLSTGGTLGVRVGQIDGTTSVYLAQTAGTITVKIDPAGAAFINAGHTASIFTVTGSTSGVSASGVTLVSPSANYNFKVFAYSIQTTGVTSAVFTFTNGAGSATELWRPLVTAAASSSSPVGANLAVTPPGYIFATGTNTTLALLNTAGVLVHYSVGYIKESA